MKKIYRCGHYNNLSNHHGKSDFGLHWISKSWTLEVNLLRLSPQRLEHRSRSAKRPSDNYENAEEISNSTDPEGGNEGTVKGRRVRKPLKGVENGAFQQETNPGSKQSESELYFGDVSSCCGPESSFYDLAVEKEGASSKFTLPRSCA